MNRATVAACVVVLVLAGCSEGENDQARTVPEPTTVEATTTADESSPEDRQTTTSQAANESADLESLVLTLDDMPSGWTTAPELLEDDDSTDTAFCGIEDAELDIEDDAAESTDAAFKQSDMGPFVFHTVGHVDGPAVASESMGRMLEAASQCEEWTETDAEGVETTYTISPLSFDNVGDDTIAFRIQAESEGFPFTIDMVMWQSQGNYLSLVGVFGVGGTDVELLTDMVDEAASRL